MNQINAETRTDLWTFEKSLTDVLWQFSLPEIRKCECKCECECVSVSVWVRVQVQVLVLVCASASASMWASKTKMQDKNRKVLVNTKKETKKITREKRSWN